jgi:ribosomal protein L21
LKDWLPHYQGCSEAVKEEVLRMSPKTMDRYLKVAKAELKRKINTGTRRGLRKMITQIPIRNLGEKPNELGHCEADTVAHCGDSMSGTFAWTLTVTDIISGWTECESVWGKHAEDVVKALKNIENRLPFAIKSFYFDNGSEFLNEDMFNEFIKSETRNNKIKVFRSRPYRKNDQCYVEQKNYTHVRLLMGYGRIDWKKAIPMMNNAYRKEWSVIQNLFSPQQQLVEKIREGSKIRRWMSEAVTPLERLSPYIPEADYQKLMFQKKSTDPFTVNAALKKKIKQMFGYFKNSIPKSQRGKILQ